MPPQSTQSPPGARYRRLSVDQVCQGHETVQAIPATATEIVERGTMPKTREEANRGLASTRAEIEQFDIDSKTGHICRDKVFSCVCKEEKGHDTPHVCKCGGSWEFDINGDFHTIHFPFKNVD